ncbi:MAG: hypothetical protein ACOVMR_12695 [Flavobacteriales bacterium]
MKIKLFGAALAVSLMWGCRSENLRDMSDYTAAADVCFNDQFDQGLEHATDCGGICKPCELTDFSCITPNLMRYFGIDYTFESGTFSSATKQFNLTFPGGQVMIIKVGDLPTAGEAKTYTALPFSATNEVTGTDFMMEITRTVNGTQVDRYVSMLNSGTVAIQNTPEGWTVKACGIILDDINGATNATVNLFVNQI